MTSLHNEIAIALDPTHEPHTQLLLWHWPSLNPMQRFLPPLNTAPRNDVQENFPGYPSKPHLPRVIKYFAFQPKSRKNLPYFYGGVSKRSIIILPAQALRKSCWASAARCKRTSITCETSLPKFSCIASAAMRPRIFCTADVWA